MDFLMPYRAISRSTISFGLVSIPVEVFPATASKSIHFNLLHAKDNSRIQEKIFCVAENKQINRNELVHGFQIRKGNYVSFTDKELKRLETGAGHEIEIVQFIPISKVDPVYFISSYLLGCGSGSAKAYHLLNAAMTNSKRAALAKFVMRGKEHLVLLRTYGEVLMLHTMHYADEIRSPEEIDHGANSSVRASELKLAERLIGDLSEDEFKPEDFRDVYRDKVLEVAEQKAAGQKVTFFAAPKRAKVTDLMTALKRSLKNNLRNGTKDRKPEIADAVRARA
ncbi:MAG: Ku protein [Deltaproteobacteria bacterium]|nr:Ku protein [Deltaproteobacteria bacterium]